MVHMRSLTVCLVWILAHIEGSIVGCSDFGSMDVIAIFYMIIGSFGSITGCFYSSICNTGTWSFTRVHRKVQ